MLGFYNFMLQAHSGWRWLVLLIIIIATVKFVIGWLAGQRWSSLDTNLIRAANWIISIQVLLGIILYILVLFQGRPNIVSFTFSHVVPAILALGAVGFGLARSRKATGNRAKFMFASIGLILTIVLVYGALVTVGGIFA